MNISSETFHYFQRTGKLFPLSKQFLMFAKTVEGLGFSFLESGMPLKAPWNNAWLSSGLMVCFSGLEKTKCPCFWNFFEWLSSGNKVACFYFPFTRSNLLANAIIWDLSSPRWFKASRMLSPKGRLSLEMVMLRERWWYSISFFHSAILFPLFCWPGEWERH